MWFCELIIGSHLRRQISDSFPVHQGMVRTPQGIVAPREGAEPSATATRRMCYQGSHQADPNTTNHQSYLQEMLGPCCWRVWADTKIYVGNAKTMLDAKGSMEQPGQRLKQVSGAKQKPQAQQHL